jgi:Sporulation and spore germination
MKTRRRWPAAILSLSSLLSLPSFLAGCHRSDPPLNLAAAARTRQARIFMISVEHGGISGPKAGCGGSAKPVNVELPVPTPALQGSLKELLAAGKRYESAGLYNSLANSPLRIERIERSGATARIYLAGYLELGGECDGSNVLAQLTETAIQFRDLDKAEFFLDGKPLRELLNGRG